MRIAFLIGVHTDVQQLIRLLDALQEYGDAYIHIDGKVKDVTFLQVIQDYADSHKNKVNISPTRIKVTWGGYSQVKWQILLMKIAMSKGLYHRYVFLSGLDYPIYSVQEMRETFESNMSKEYVFGYNITLNRDYLNSRKIIYRHYFRDIPLPHKSIIRRIIIGGTFLFLKYLGIRQKPYLIVNSKKWDVYYGSQWTALTGECAKFIVKQIDNEKSISEYFSHTYAPDELVIPTIVFNSKFASKAVRKDYYDFSELAPLHFLKSTDHVWTYDENDYDTLIRSKKMFVRKLVSGKSEMLIQLLERRKENYDISNSDKLSQ